jgi:hypothetical protein
MAKGLRYLVALEKRKKFLEAAGVSEKDFFLASFPKSGNTWLRYLLAYAAFPPEEISHKTLSSFLPSVYHEPFKIDHLTPPRFIKTHEAFFRLYPKTIYICRDYRDVVVSSFHYLTKKNLFHGSISDLIHDEKLNAFGKWSWHVSSALEWKEKNPGKIHFVKYEDLLASPESELKAILDFCQISSSKPLAEIIRLASFENLRKNEETVSKQGEAYFFRKGISGDWKTALTENDVEYILSDKKTNALLKKLGYL